MSKSEKKVNPNASNVCLPFPHPVLRSDGLVQWPFTESGFPLFFGSIDLTEKCVEISDKIAIKSLQLMGFFGFHSKFKFVSNTDRKTNVLVKGLNEESIQSMDKKDSLDSKDKNRTQKHLNGKYVLISTSIPDALSDHQSPEKTTIGTNLGEEESNNASNLLKLSFLESFFISFIFGSLNVLNVLTNNYMTIDEMWDIFGSHYSEDKLEFAVHYSAYHYFRSKGWVVRNGHSFGTHFLLYKEGPHLYHSLYSVIIQYTIDGQYKQPFDWYYMSALIRLSRNELINCVVNVPKDCDISSPKCIQNFEIDLLKFERWNAIKGNGHHSQPLP